MKIKELIVSLLILTAVLFVPPQAFSQEKNCDGRKITVFGDSLVAGYGLGPGEGFPEQLKMALDEKGYSIEITNAGVSGDTTTGGLARLDWSIGGDTHAVILELGANDALRGIPPEITRKNLEAMIIRLKEKEVHVLIAGMMAPPNMGETYGKEFNAIYAELAEKHDVLLYPFFLEGVAADPALNQADGIHPTKEGIAVMVNNFMQSAEALVKSTCR